MEFYHILSLHEPRQWSSTTYYPPGPEKGHGGSQQAWEGGKDHGWGKQAWGSGGKDHGAGKQAWAGGRKGYGDGGKQEAWTPGRKGHGGKPAVTNESAGGNSNAMFGEQDHHVGQRQRGRGVGPPSVVPNSSGDLPVPKLFSGPNSSAVDAGPPTDPFPVAQQQLQQPPPVRDPDSPVSPADDPDSPEDGAADSLGVGAPMIYLGIVLGTMARRALQSIGWGSIVYCPASPEDMQREILETLGEGAGAGAGAEVLAVAGFELVVEEQEDATTTPTPLRTRCPDAKKIRGRNS